MSHPASEFDGTTDVQMLQLVRRVGERLRQRELRLVLAESCTAGQVAAALAWLPGISQWLCGSFVVYRSSSKHDWLQIPSQLLDDPQIGPVSSQVSRLLAEAALQHTPDAHVSVAVTGDVGPGAAPATDGCLFLAAAQRSGPYLARPTAEQRLHLAAPAPVDTRDIAARQLRLAEATEHVLKFVIQVLSAL